MIQRMAVVYSSLKLHIFYILIYAQVRSEWVSSLKNLKVGTLVVTTRKERFLLTKDIFPPVHQLCSTQIIGIHKYAMAVPFST